MENRLRRAMEKIFIARYSKRTGRSTLRAQSLPPKEYSWTYIRPISSPRSLEMARAIDLPVTRQAGLTEMAIVRCLTYGVGHLDFRSRRNPSLDDLQRPVQYPETVWSKSWKSLPRQH
jgi:hypothetical protein